VRGLLLALTLTGLAPVAAGAQETAPEPRPMQLRDAWVRAQPSAAGQSVLYGTLVNTSDRDRTITRVLCERVARAEVHETVVHDDLVTMRRVPELRIPKGQSVELRPGGAHLMLMGLEAPLAPGGDVSCAFLAGDTVLARGRGVVR